MVKQLFIKMVMVSFSIGLFLVTFALAQQPKAGGTITIAIRSEMTRDMDARYWGPPNLNVAPHQIYEFLTTFGSKGMRETIPGLAESWKQVDPVTYLFYIRKGVKFHNGREMTAEDVKTNLDWLLKTPEGWMPVFRRAFVARFMDKVETVDRYTIRIRLKAPFAPLTSALRMVRQGIVPPEEVKKWGKDFTLHPSGTGPFKFVEMIPGDRVVMERFEGYWGKRPYLDRVIFRYIPDEQARLVALQTGEVDVAKLELTGLPVVRKDQNLRVFESLSLADYIGVWFNMRNWPMSSLKFRTAVTMAAEWPKFTKATYAGVLVRTALEKTWAEDPKVKELLPTYDPEGAKRLIKEVEAEAGKPIPRLIFLTPVSIHQAQIGELSKTFLKKLGVEVTVSVREDFTEVYKSLKWDILCGASRGPGADPYFTFNFFATGGEGEMPDGKNRMGYVNPKVDELLKRAVTTDDRGERGKIYQEIERVIIKDLPGFYLYAPPTIYAMNKKVQDFGLHDEGGVYLTTLWNNTWIAR